jgi:hypothetical protein
MRGDKIGDSSLRTLNLPPESTTDLIPNNFVLGAMVLYVANVLFDISRKFVAKK